MPAHSGEDREAPISQEEQAALDQIEAIDRRRAEREGRTPPSTEELKRMRPSRLEAIRGELAHHDEAREDEEKEEEPADAGEQERQSVYEEAAARLEGVQNKPPDERVDEELEQAVYEASVAWLRLKWGQDGRAPHCPYCDTRNWAVEPPFSIVGKGSSLPVFPVICAECGHTTFVSAEVADLPFGQNDDPPDDK